MKQDLNTSQKVVLQKNIRTKEKDMFLLKMKVY